MSTAIQALATLLPVLYLALALLYAMALGGPRAPKPRRSRDLMVAVLLLTHIGYGICLWSAVGHFPVTERWTALSMLAFGLVAVYLVVEVRTKSPNTGVFVIGSCFVLQLVASSFAPREPDASTFAESSFFEIHVASIVFALAALLLSGFYGALYLVLLRQMRRRTFGILYATLPDLDTLSRMNRGAAVAGFVLMTLGLNIGIWWAHSGGTESFSYLDAKVLAAMGTWILFGVIGVSRWIRFLSGRRAAVVTVCGVSLVLLTLLVSFVPASTFHAFG